MSASSLISVRVLKGCSALNVGKGARAFVAFAVAPNVGVQVWGLGPLLWLPGRRVNIPALVVGATLRLNDGSPQHSVVVEIVGVSS